MPDKHKQAELYRILGALKSDDETRQRAAIQDLERINYSSEAIVSQLEQLVLQGNETIKKLALNALSLRTSQSVTSNLSGISRQSRKLILDEIDAWQEDELIEPYRAEIIRRRYDFDITPGIPVKMASAEVIKPEPVEKVETLEPVAPVIAQPKPPRSSAPQRPAGPRPSLTQILLSATSIRIYLDLGAFFVIASATILAALVEAARLPILLIATLAFAAGAVGFKKRLPQPSFAFAIVFSFLLPIDASVIADLLSLSVQGSHAYWSVIFLFMGMIWAFGTWFYESRLFSLASFIALTFSALRFANALNASDDWITFTFGSTGLIGLLGVRFLKNWKDQKFAQPLFFTIQFLQAITLFISVTMIAVNLFNAEVSPDKWIAHMLTWLFAASFYAASDILIPFVFFPWMSAASLFPVPWLFLSAFNASAPTMIAGFGTWGALVAFGSEFAQRSKNAYAQKYHYPSLALSLPLFLIGISWALIEDLQYAFTALLGAGIIYTLINIIRPRWYVWMTALLAGLGAYFTFFALPLMEKTNIYFGYQLLIGSVLLLLPELFFKEPLAFGRSWNWPPVALGTLLMALNIMIAHTVLLDDDIYFGRAAVTMGVYAILFAAYALRFRQPLIGYLGTTSLTLTVVYALARFDWWLPALTTLTAIYYFSGYVLARREKSKAWSAMLINSGLALGAIFATIAVLNLKETGGWYVIIVSALFAIEMFTRRNGYLEILVAALLNIALIIILNDFKVGELAYYLYGSSLIWLGSDGIFNLTYKNRKLHDLTRLVGGSTTLAAIMMITLLNGLTSGSAAICFGVYTAFFASYALLYKWPVLGYLSTASAAGTMFYALDYFNVETWLPIFTGLSLAYYAAGYFMRKERAGWSEMFRYSGLALGSVVSLVALVNFSATGGWYAAIVGLLFVVEMITTRNGWFEAGVYIPLSVAVLLILGDFKVHEYSYILLALSLAWLGMDAIFEVTFVGRKLSILVRLVGAGLALLNARFLVFSPPIEAAICFGVYAPFFAMYALLYNRPIIGYASTISLPLSVFFGLRAIDQAEWLFPLIAIAVIYYSAGFSLRRAKFAEWDRVLLFSGLGHGMIVALLAPFQPGGLEKAIPIAITATLFAVEAFALRNVWLAFPANSLYLISYFVLLIELKVDEPQYFSIGAALLGMFMHYLLVRANSKTGAFIMGMISQLVLLGTTYIQMVSTSELSFFFVLFAQSLVVLAYGIIMRSRSLVIAPIGFAVLGVVTVLYSALKDLSLVVIIGVTGIILLGLGIFAVIMRERITMLAEQFSDWSP